MPTNRVTSRFPVSVDLIGPLESFLEAIGEEGLGGREKYQKAKRLIQIAKQQAVKLNQLLSDLQNNQQEQIVSSGGTGGSGGSASGLTADTPEPVGTAGAVGSSSEGARADHIHQGLTSLQLAGELLKIYGNATLSEGDGIEITQLVSDLEIGATVATRSKVYHLPILGPRVSLAVTDWTSITHPTPVRGTETESVKLTFPWKAENAVATAHWRLYDVENATTVLSGTRAAPFTDMVEEVTTAASAMPGTDGLVAIQVKGTAGQIEFYGPAMWEAV